MWKFIFLVIKVSELECNCQTFEMSSIRKIQTRQLNVLLTEGS